MLITFADIILWSLWVIIALGYKPHLRWYDYYYYPAPMEVEEIDPLRYTTPIPRRINGTRVEVPWYYQTPDYRVEETPYFRYYHFSYFEEDRPYRISPFRKQILRWIPNESPDMMGCTCTTVYRKFHMLATCAVLTRRHVLTTATSTELILRKRRHFKHLEDILGVWYDNTENTYNSSMYGTPGRIHYHPRYIRPTLVNRSHPFPMTFDLALWTMTHRLYGGVWYRLFAGRVAVCERGSSHWLFSGTPTPPPDLMVIIVAFQFIKAFGRNPLPWVKYAVRTRKHIQPCPKTEWGWFHCISTVWAKLGLDQGANMHRTFQGGSWLYDGLLGMNTLSIQLRTVDMVHYFINLDSHPILDFLYDSYMGMIAHEYLDYRFEAPRGYTIEAKDYNMVFWNWDFGEEKLYNMDLPNYK